MTTTTQPPDVNGAPESTLDEEVEALAPQVEAVARGIYAVPSRSEPGGLHVVCDRQVAGVSGAARLGRWCCDCRAYGFDSSCAHIEAVIVRRRQERRRREAAHQTKAPLRRRRP